MLKILSIVLFLVALLGVVCLRLVYPPPFASPLELAVVALLFAALLLVVAPLVRSRRVHGIGVASLLRRCCRFAMLLTLALTWLVPGAEAQVRYRPWTNVPPTVATLASSNIQANAFTLRKDQGVGIQIIFTATNAVAVTNVVIPLDVSGDGSNWTTIAPLQANFAASLGATNQVHFTNLISGDMARLNNTFRIRPRAITNLGAATLTIGSIGWTYNNE